MLGTLAVGKRVAPLPPRRSRRALLTHRAPPSGQTSGSERFGRAHRPAHNRQPDRRGCPALCPDRGRLTAVPLGPGPSLHVLRWKSPSIVRSLLRYYGPVRLLTRVHVQRTACGLPEPARTKIRARMRSPRFRTKDVSTCMGSQTAQGPSHTRLQRMGRCCLLFSGTRSAPRNSTRFAAQYPAHGLPCERFTSALADCRASLGAGAAG